MQLTFTVSAARTNCKQPRPQLSVSSPDAPCVVSLSRSQFYFLSRFSRSASRREDTDGLPRSQCRVGEEVEGPKKSATVSHTSATSNFMPSSPSHAISAWFELDPVGSFHRLRSFFFFNAHCTHSLSPLTPPSHLFKSFTSIPFPWIIGFPHATTKTQWIEPR